MQRFKQDYERDEKEHLKRISELEAEVNKIQIINELLSQEVQRLRNEAAEVQYLKNEHRAGRKKKLNNSVIKIIKQYRSEGKTQSEIAGLLNLSVGLINKGCKMLKENDQEES